MALTPYIFSEKCSMSKIELVIESRYENIDLVGTCIESLSSQLFEEQQCHQIKVCVYEAVTNCIKHGYRGSLGQKVYISYEMNAERIILDISDAGASMDPQLLKDTSTDFQIDLDNPKEGGMGLKIIKSFMDETQYQIKDGMNHLTLVKYAKPLSDSQ